LSGGSNALAVQDTKILSIGTQAGAEWRVLISAALIGSGVGMALGATYMAGGMAQAATDHGRASRIAEAAAGGFSEAVLQRDAAGMDPGVLRVAREHDPFGSANVERDRQAAVLAAGLERKQTADLTLRANLQAVGSHPGTALDASRELDCLTQAVYFEARGETPRGQAAVATVVLNRVKHPAFPKSVCGVVFQGSNRRTGCQFSFACDGSMRRGREASAWSRARKVAARALSGAVLGDVGSATHFHTTGVSPAWGPQMRRVAQVGLHVFYRFNPRGFTAPRPALQDHAVFASLTPADGAAPLELRLSNAVVETAPDAGQAATPAASTPAPATEAKPTPKLPDTAPAGLSKAADTSIKAQPATASAS
jgi:spore germination cell wall hydrolase CwlJ-like protein